MAVEAAGGFSSQANVNFDIATDSNYQEEIQLPFREGFAASDSTINVEHVDLHVWTAEKNARFKELAREEAIRDLPLEELAELDFLARIRRGEKYPRSADEILWGRRQEKLTLGLVNALEAYVEFHELSHSS
jgi:hypothetical protein